MSLWKWATRGNYKIVSLSNIYELIHKCTCLTWQNVPSGQSASGTILLHRFSGPRWSCPLFTTPSLLLLMLLLLLGGRVSGGLRVTLIFGFWTTSRFWPVTLMILPPLQSRGKEDYKLMGLEKLPFCVTTISRCHRVSAKTIDVIMCNSSSSDNNYNFLPSALKKCQLLLCYFFNLNHYLFSRWDPDGFSAHWSLSETPGHHLMWNWQSSWQEMTPTVHLPKLLDSALLLQIKYLKYIVSIFQD